MNQSAIFENPKLLSEILEEYYDLETDNRAKRIFHSIAKKLSRREAEEFETYKEGYVFKNVQGIPDSYPVFALRAIRLRSWQYSDFISELTRIIRERRNVEHSQKYKHRRTKNGSTKCDFEMVSRRKYSRDNFDFHTRKTKPKKLARNGFDEFL